MEPQGVEVRAGCAVGLLSILGVSLMTGEAWVLSAGRACSHHYSLFSHDFLLRSHFFK